MNLNIKKTILVLSTAIFSFAGWYFFASFIQHFGLNLSSNQWGNLALAIVFLSLGFAGVFGQALSLDKKFFIPTAALPGLIMIYFTGVSWPFLIAALLLIALCENIIRFPQRLAQTIKLKYYSGIVPFIAGISLVLLVVTGLFIQQGLNKPGQTQTVFNQAIDYSWNYIKPLAPQFNTDQTVDQFITSEYQKQGINKPTAAMIADGRKELSTQVGKQLTGREKMSDVGKVYLQSKLNDFLPKQTKTTSPYSWYLIFGALLIVWPFLKFVIAGIIDLVLRGLRATGFLKVQETQIISNTLVL